MRLNKKDLPQTDGEWTHRGAWFSMLNGRLHNSLGPALIYDDGSKQWWIDGTLHRLDGAAAEYNNGRKEWYVNGQQHRLDGPAVECADGLKYWYIDGKRVLERDFPSAVISFLLGVDKKTSELLEQELKK